MTSTISRRQILSRSNDAGLDRYHQKQQQLDRQKLQNRFAPYEDYEEMWFSHEHLFKDHIAEVLRKWEQIDDEIWAKIIFMSRNRRIAKAYVRVPAIIIDGTDNGFDGYRVGLNGFEDPFRDSQTDQLMHHIDKGCRIGIDDNGNILIKRYSQANVFVKSYPLDFSRSCVENNIKRSNGLLELQKKYILFDMQKFELAMLQELKSAYPDRSKLQQQCIVIVGFVRDNNQSILDMPIYIMLINIVALDMLKSKLNPVLYKSLSNITTTNNNYHHQNRVNNKNHKINNSNGKIRVPEFVSIFQHSESDDLNNCCDTNNFNDDPEIEEEYDDDDEIYGRIGDLDATSKEYLSATTWNNNDRYQMNGNYHHHHHNFNDHHHLHSGYFHNNNHNHHHSDNGPQSMPTLSAIRYPYRNNNNNNNNNRSNQQERFIIDDGNGTTSSRPPKLPPRDKKKLSKQINTIKSARKASSTRLVEIPSPDYHQQQEDQPEPESENQLIKMFQHRLSRRRNNNKNKNESTETSKTNNSTKTSNNTNTNNNDNIYGTIVAKSKSTRSRSQWDRLGQQQPNWLVSSSSNNNHHNVDDNGIVRGRRNGGSDLNNLYRTTATGKSMPANLQLLSSTYNSNNFNRSRVDTSQLDLEEDPYYSGLEARVTSNKLNNSTIHNGTNKMKGLNWMMRKVLSANYINILTSRRHKKKIPKSKSSTESSTDSDPYVSINDVYEPIYGYGHGNGRINYGWPTMQTRFRHYAD